MDWNLKKLKGSYTVEMALISGCWLLVIFASLLLILGCYGRVWDTAAICEAAVYGSGTAVCRKADGVRAAQERVEALEGHYSAGGNKTEIMAAFEDKTEIPFAELIWKRKGVWKSKVIRPVVFIEKVEKARRLWGNNG